MSTHIAEVVKYTLEKHPNADTLSIATIKGWICVVKTQDFLIENPIYKDLNLGVYIPIEMVADKDHPLLSFLEGKKVKTKRLRGVISQGVLLPLQVVVEHYLLKKLPEEGDDLTQVLGITRWKPPVDLKELLKTKERSAEISRPEYMDKYTDVENLRNWNKIFQKDQEVVVTEKIHGSNFSAAIINNRFYLSSRNRVLRLEPVSIRKPIFKYRKLNKFLEKTFMWPLFSNVELVPVDTTIWHRAVKQYDLETKLKQISDEHGNADVVLYGEVCPTQKLTYNFTVDNIGLFIFDLRIRTREKDLGYLPQSDTINLMKKYNLPTVPVYYIGPFKDELLDLRNGKSVIAEHIKEGIVIQPSTPQYNKKLGRVILKLKGDEFLLKDYE